MAALLLPTLALSFHAIAPLPRMMRATPLTMNVVEVDEESWTKTASGLQYIDEKVGDGESPNSGDVVKVTYTGWIEATGREFDSSKGRAPIAFPLGAGRVIPGWDEGISSMKVGGKRRLSIPADLAYGEKGAGESIPPNSRSRSRG